MDRRQYKAFSAVMLTLILIGMLAFAFNVQPAKSILPLSPPVDWANTYGGTDFEVCWSVIETTSVGGYALAGGTSSYGAGGGDFYLVKTLSNGIKHWDRTYGGSGWDFATCVIQTNDGGYALAGEGFANLVKTDPNGIKQWERAYGGTGLYAFSPFSVIQTNDGGYALAGSIVVSYPNYDMMLVKTDSSGYEQWHQLYGGTAAEQGVSVIEISGGYMITGSTASFGGGFDFYLVKTDSLGNPVWSKTYGGMGTEVSRMAIKTSDGGYALAGYQLKPWGPGSTDLDFWLVKTDSSGNVLWDKAYNRGADFAHSLVQSSGGGYALAGYSISVSGGADIWLIKTDVYGNPLWSATYATPTDRNFQYPRAIWTSDGGYAVAGTFNPAGSGAPTTAYDLRLIKLLPILSAPVIYPPPKLTLSNNNPYPVRAAIWPPSGYILADIDNPSSISWMRLGGTLQVDSTMSLPAVLMVKFIRSDVNSFVNGLPISIPPGGTWILLTIIGALGNGRVFEATGYISVEP